MAGKFTDVLPDGHGAHLGGHVHVDSVSTHAPSGAIIVPDAHLLFTGDFKRTGVDLVLSGDGRELVLHDYFKGEKRAALASPDGAHLTGNIVSALTGHTQLAQADGSPSVAQVIGHVTKLVGTATAIRNGVSIILNNGDNVNKGDVVQSGSDSTLGITFIDGSVFGLASNARMVLNEMIYDPNGSNNSSLISLVQGTISFVAGATAKKGDMKVDTPVATMGIRGTAVLVEIDFAVPGQGGAPPAKFQVLVEPDGTTGSYILFDKTTMTPIATVNQAGTQTIVSGQGTVNFLSSVQLSPDAQKIISDVFQLKFTDLNNPQQLHRFTDSPVPENMFIRLAGGETVPVKVTVTPIIDTPVVTTTPTTVKSGDHIPGPPDVITSNAAFTERAGLTGSAAQDTLTGEIAYSDLNPGDVPTAQASFASFKYENAQHSDVSASLTSEQIAAIKAVEVPLTVVQDPNQKNRGTATWTYSVPDGAFDFLAAGETLTLTYLARVDNNFAANNEITFKTFTITISGTNDAPTVATSGGTVIERDGTGNTTIDTISGTVTFTDTDLTDRPVVTAAISTTEPFRYLDAQGHNVTATLTPAQLAAIAAVKVPLSVTQGGANGHNGSATWTYSIADHAFDFLAKGEKLILNYVIKVDDGHGGVVYTPVSISINGADVTVIGTNDVPTIVPEWTTATGEMTEDAAATLTANGTITFQDLDLTDTHAAAFALKSSNATANLPGYSEAAPLGQIGTFALTAISENPGVSTVGSLGWNFTLNDNDPVLQSLAKGQTITQIYTVTISDNNGAPVTQDVTVTITGTNDTPTIVGGSTTATGGVTEDTGVNDSGNIETSGTITFGDLDLIDTHTAGFVLKSTNASVNLPGFAEGNGALAANIGTFALTGVNESATDTVNTASIGWNFTLNDNDPVLQSLAKGQTIVQIYTVTISDNNGVPVTQDVTVTITGTNDTPTIVGASTTAAGGVTEDVGVNVSGDIATSGMITFGDLDLIDAHTAGFVLKSTDASVNLPGFAEGNGALAANIGTFALTGVNESATDTVNTASIGWSFTLNDNDPVLQSLALGQTITQIYTVTIIDSNGAPVTQDVTVTIAGTNDVPVAVADTDTGHIVEAGNNSDNSVLAGVSTTSGDVLSNDTDVDLIDTHHVIGVVAGSISGVLTNDDVGATVVGTYGSLVLNANGTWTYTLDNTNPLTDSLAHGAHASDVFSYTESDGYGGTSTTTLTIDITGTNDAPVANAAPVAVTDVNSGAPVSEQGVSPVNDAFAGVASATGNVLANDLDVDAGDTKTVQGVASGTQTGPLTVGVASVVAGTYGSVTIDANGAWTYTLDNTKATTQALTQDQHVADVFTYTMHDVYGATASATLTIDVTGTNDAPTLAPATVGPLLDTAVTDSYNTITGTLVGYDADSGEAATLSYGTIVGLNAVNSAVAGLYGSLTVDEDGHYIYTPDAAAINALHAGTQTETFTVQTADVNGATGIALFTVNVTGANDTATISADWEGSLIEDAFTSSGEIVPLDTVSGTLTVSDVDTGEGHFQAVDPDLLDGAYGTFTFTFDSGTGGWTYQLDNSKVEVQSLGEGTSVTDTLTVTSIDGTEKNIVVTINGTNDAPDYSGKSLASTYHAGDSPVAIVYGVAAADIDGDNYAGGTLTATVTAGHEGDTLSIVGNDYIWVDSGSIVHFDSDGDDPGGDVAIGTLAHNGDNSLTVTLNGSAGDTAVKALTQAIEFSNSKPDPVADTRTVTFTLWDGHGVPDNGHDSDYFEAHVTVPESAGAAPVIQTDLFTVSELGDGVTMVSGLYVTDADASETETFTFTATTGASPDSSVSIDPGDLEDIDEALGAVAVAGVTYNPGGGSQPQNDSVKFTVTDGFGHSDTVNFIFNVTGESDVELTGTDGKDVIFATGNTDTLTGGAGADQFVFRVGDGNDTITDFKPGQDHIDLRAFFETINPETIDAWLHDHAAPSQNDPADMVLWLGGDDNITLKQVASLTANDFILHPGIGN
ncbi:VCBS domain-containing protein [Bradyrhizobium sp. AUGA SZCCT0182]|uniref:VCBS domain-containing protein n=1 Tax=Bradyrhizobium sp. AUGA SZCCT0182 TaxID=2807667 RepID=UPI001BA95509|nr:VCBS domain-containing protein [Bradyrhizobium sp. AUGA SZCCT0182]MBR1237406.1 VCBS domain-containing protein [Bradyrhizobium sp. AUGA SZCCT0182]